MKRAIMAGSFLIIIILTLAPSSSDAFNPLAHIYIADKACKNAGQNCSPKIDFYYGSFTPDIALYVANKENWLTAFDDTHVNYIHLRGLASGATQMAFAKGWLTHGQNHIEKGADYFAHIAYSNDPITPGYVIERAGELVNELALSHGWDPADDRNHEFAHYIIEATIDLLLKRDYDSTLPGKLLFANLFRFPKDRRLLMKVFVWNWKDRRTDWLTLATAELTLRQLVNRYATALMLPDPNDKAALAQLGEELAQEMFGLDEITAEDLLIIFPVASGLCVNYYDVIEEAIEEVEERF